MEEKLVLKICREVYRRFPETRGVRPKIQLYGSEKRSSSQVSPKFLLVFQGQGTTDTERFVKIVVRVVVDSEGKILKMSMSH